MAYRAKQDTYEGKRVPIYKQIYAVLHKEIDEGLYNEDYRLPSEKELTERFHVELQHRSEIFADAGGRGNRGQNPGLWF